MPFRGNIVAGLRTVVQTPRNDARRFVVECITKPVNRFGVLD